MEQTISDTHTSQAIDGKSANIAEEKQQQLKALFPEAFTEGKIDFAQLRAVLGDMVEDDQQHYGLSWAGKYEAFREIQKQTTATLVPDREESIDFDTTGNIFIEGENLEVQRVLQKSYYGKVKMIYIDPPYNTGNDHFIYPDDFAERLEEYQKRTGIKDEEGFLNKQDLWKKNTRENGHFHSVWLSMMYPRLYLARNLLRDDGVIFVSIDDNEVANLRLLMDEVFGEENFVAEIIWQKKYTRSNDAEFFSTNHDYILCYCKRTQFASLNLLPRTEQMLKAYANPDNHPKGLWKATPLHAKSGRETNFSYTFENGITWSPPKATFPRYSTETLARLDRNNEIWFGQDGKATPSRKSFLSDIRDGVTPITIWLHNEVGNTHQASDELKAIGLGGTFNNPKPTELIKQMLRLVTQDQTADLILDFFAGSGSTAHAVLNLNREDGGNRKFICVQMPEPTDEKSEARKAGYESIADISRTRIRKVIDKIKEEDAGKLDLEEPGDLGFRSYRIAPSNFKAWRGTVEGQDMETMLLEFQEAHRKGAVAENMVTELLLKAGLPLTANVEPVSIGATRLYNVDDGTMIVLLERIEDAVRDYLLETKPAHVVCLDTVFENNDQLLTNLGLQLEEAGIELTVI